jgi:prevent-host-death family protein
MITAGIKDAKNNLSRYLALVKAGEEVVITERGKAVARIVGEGEGKRSIRLALTPLIRCGLIELPSRALAKDQLLTVRVRGKPVSEMVIEDRR